MPTIPQTEIPVPKSWDEFEDIVADLYLRLWDDPHAQRYGRSGQAQQGVDIYGQPARLQDGYAAIQCKRLDRGTLTRAIIQAEIAKAERFTPPLAEYTIATTDRRDAKLQQAVREINDQRRAAGQFPVHIVFWEDLCSHLSHPDNHDFLLKHYGDWLRHVAQSSPELTREHRRIDATAPSHADIDQQIDVLVQVRFPDSPLLGIEDWPMKRRPPSIGQASEPVTLEFPLDPRTGKLGSAHLEARVVAPDFTIEGAARKLVEVPPDQYSKCIQFLLTAERVGNCRINIEMYNVDDVYLGTIPVEVETTGVRVATPPTAIVSNLFLVVVVEHGGTAIVDNDLSVQQAKGRYIAQASGGSIVIAGNVSGQVAIGETVTQVGDVTGQVGIIGDHARVEGDIHFNRQVTVYDGVKPVSAGALLDACQAQVASILYDARHKYDSKLYVNRAIERDLCAFFDTSLDGPAPNCFLIVAPAGSGKTNLLCDLARVRVSHQPVLLLMGGSTYLSGTTGLLGAVKEELETASSQVAFRSAGDSLHILHRLAEEMGRDALLFLDAINEHDRPAAMRQALEDLLRKTRDRRVKLVVTCRDYYWGLFKGRFWEGATVNNLPTEGDVGQDDTGTDEDDFSCFAADEHERALELYLEHYGISGRPVGDAAKQCRHPLLLRFFCEAYRGQDVGQAEDIRLKELFDRYWDQKLLSIADRMIKQGDERLQDGLAEEVGGYLLNVAAYMLHHNVRAIPLADMSQATGYEERYDDPRSVYGRIRDEFIILEEKERGKGQRRKRQVAFVYEEFMEYVMARSLIRDWDQVHLGNAAILAEIEKLTDKYENFAQIIGVIVYLALMLKEDRNLALWSLLLDSGEHWPEVVLEAFRKLPEEQLDATVFDTLEEVLITDDESFQKQVLDILKSKRVGRASTASIVRVMCTLAAHDQESFARRAVLALGNTKQETNLVISVLIRFLSDCRNSVWNNAGTSLTRLGSPTVDPLIAALKNNRTDERKRIVSVLGKLKDARAVDPLIATLKDDDADVRAQAASALGELMDERAVDPLIAALKDDHADVRAQAALALGELMDVRAVDPLIAALKDDDADVRTQAVLALGKLGDERAVEPLIAILKDDHPDARSRATSVLVKLGKSAIQPLIAALKDNHAGVRSRAASALGELVDERAVEPLIAILKDDDSDVRSQAASALGKLRYARAVDPLIAVFRDEHPNARLQAASALIELGKPAVEPLIAALKNDHTNVRSQAASALGKLRAQAVDPLIVVLKDSHPDVRSQSASALGKLMDARAVEPLIAALKDDHVSVRSRAILALMEFKDERVVDPLIVALKDSHPDVRSQSASALGKLMDARAVEPLIAALKDDHVSVRSRAILALMEFKDERAVDPLIVALKDSHPDVRSQSASALGKLMDARAVEPLIAALKDDHVSVRSQAILALMEFKDERVVEPLIVALKDSHPDVRSQSASALGKLMDARAVEPLIAALEDDHDNVRDRAVSALIEFKDARAVEPLISVFRDCSYSVQWRVKSALVELGKLEIKPLIAALKDSHPDVQSQVASVLVELGESAVGPLIATLKDDSLNARLQAAFVLVKLGKPAVEPLITALKDDHPNVRSQAASALGRLKNTRAVEPLITALEDDYADVRSQAASALGRLRGTRAVEPLIIVLKDNDAYVRSQAASALGKLRYVHAVEPLINALKDDHADVRSQAASALGKLWATQAIEPLIAALKDDYADVRLQAASALGRLKDARAVKPLIAAFKDDHTNVRSQVALALVKLGKPAVKPLIDALKENDQLIRSGAASALGQLRDAQATEPLIAVLKDDHTNVRLSATRSLGQIGQLSELKLLGSNSGSTRREAASSLGKLGDLRTVEPLIAALRDEHKDVRWEAASALGKLGDVQAVEFLTDSLKDCGYRMRWEVVSALVRLGKPAVEPLIAALKDDHTDVRRGAASALGKLRDTRAVEPLISLLKEDDQRVRLEAATALGNLRDARSIEPLISAFRDSDQRVRSEVALALGKLGKLAIKPLTAALEDNDRRVRSGVASALGEIGRLAMDPLIADLKDSKWNVRRRAVSALGKMGIPAVEPLIAALKDSDGRVRSRAASALGRIKDSRAVEPLIDALNDCNSAVRQVAVKALQRFSTNETRLAVQQYERRKREQ